MAYSYRNNATIHPSKPLAQSEFEALTTCALDTPKAQLLFADALDEERKRATKTAKFRLKYLIERRINWLDSRWLCRSRSQLTLIFLPNLFFSGKEGFLF